MNKSRLPTDPHPKGFQILSALLLITITLTTGCNQDSWTRIKSMTKTKEAVVEAHAIHQLLRADGVCLARIDKVIEKNEMPSDGDHFQEVWIEPIHSSGKIPSSIRVIIRHGGNMPLESVQELTEAMKTHLISKDTLRPNERHWFLFSDDFDSTKYPYRVAGWWPHQNQTVPRAIVDAVEDAQLQAPREWDPKLDLIATWQSNTAHQKVSVRAADPKNESTKQVEILVPGTIKNVSFYHHPFSYEMLWPATGEMHVLHIETLQSLESDNDYDLPASSYRVNLAIDPLNGNRIAEWIAADQEIWFMKAFRQFNPESGEVILDLRYELLDHGGVAAGSNTEHWYRKTSTSYEEDGSTSVKTYRHEYIKTGMEPIYSSTNWIPVDESLAEPNQ
ncbi:MAG: hypothetical protein ACON4H_02565 [Rubripirellula sp.]